MYEVVDAMPEDGHFLLLWTYNNKVWSETFTYIGRGFRRYIPESDDYSEITDPMGFVPRDAEDVQFLIRQ